MIRILIFSLLVLAALSCSRDRKIAPDAPRLTGLLKTVTVQSSSGETKEEYTYSDSFTLKSIRCTRGGQSMVETFKYENDTLRTSQVGDTLKKYVYQNKRLVWIEKHVTGKPESAIIVMFNYYSGDKVSSIEKRLNRPGNFQEKFSIIWRGDNISMFREYFADGLVEDYDFQYSESRSPYSRLYSETLRIPAENPHILSYNNTSNYSTFYTGKKYRVEGKYLANRFPVSETIYEFDSGNGGEWKVIKQNTFEYYE